MVASLALAVALAIPSGGVPSSLLQKFTTGVNVTRWFCYLEPGDHAAHFKTYWTNGDNQALRRIGAHFVRLCVSPDFIYREGAPVADTLGALDLALGQLQRQNLAVILDLHDNGQLKLDSADEKTRSDFVRFWHQMAAHYKGGSEGSLVFELLNEPTFQKNEGDWYSLQAQAVKAIRSVDKRRTIMVSPTTWSSIDKLLTMKPLPEKNLLYTFHCYDPFFFTHQGAEWVGDYPGKFQKVPFPSSPSAVEAILPLNGSQYHAALQDYGRQAYGEAYLRSRISRAMQWGRSNGVPCVLGEFGAYPKVSPPESRARWFVAMRKAIEASQAPNAIWGYDDALGLGRSLTALGRVILDPVCLKSFYGLQPGEASAVRDRN